MLKPRLISNEELADLPEKWENPTVDITKYYQCCTVAWEVDEPTYQRAKKEGCLCQVVDGRHYVGDMTEEWFVI